MTAAISWPNRLRGTLNNAAQRKDKINVLSFVILLAFQPESLKWVLQLAGLLASLNDYAFPSIGERTVARMQPSLISFTVAGTASDFHGIPNYSIALGTTEPNAIQN